MKKEYRKYKNLEFVLSLPDNFREEEKYPVIIFLHGAGTRGNNISEVAENLFYKICEKYKKFDFVTAAPQCNADSWFDIFSEVIEFSEYIQSLDFIDPSRIYGMGASMGGYGIWQLAMSCPDRFAAIVPICGGGMYWNAARLKNIPVWAFHGDCDAVVDKSESEKMVTAVNRCGGTAKLTVYPNCGHDAWSETYGNAEVFEWLARQSKKGDITERTKFDNSEIYG